MITIHHPWVFAFGILGNVISFMVFLAPLPTFIRIYKKKSTEGFQSVPYVVAIFSAMLWIYYAMLKGNSLLLITVNVAGVIIETIYVVVFVTYAPRQAKMFTLKLLMFMNFGGFCAIVLLCHYLAKGEVRVQVFGWVCVVFSVSVFAAPLSIIRSVIRTKSVEYMPFNLSLCLTLTATIWFFYGFVQKDLYITLPNIVGFVFGVVQMILYGIYRKHDKMAQKHKLPEQQVIVEITTSPMKQNNTTNNTVETYNALNCTPKTKDIIPPQQNNNEVEVVIANIGNIDNIECPNKDKDDRPLHGSGTPTCNVDLGFSVCGPGPSSAQLVQCAV
ncbi:hypothetical protein RND81_02G047900 [Saponaria officinalis]|uniref:Bidirectional sugar transporter SWEET n=1 Tax=Saponaria officinalis TaxID=3572 RepID=A0AAW1MPY7_SAPOF